MALNKHLMKYWRLFVFAILTSLLSGFSLGYHVTVTNVSHDVFVSFINKSIHRVFPMSTEGLECFWAFNVASINLGACIGVLIAHLIVSRGSLRISVFIYTNFFVIAGSMLLGFAPAWTLESLFLIGRGILGIAAGLTTTLVPTIMAGCSPVPLLPNLLWLLNVSESMYWLIGTVLSSSAVLGTEAQLRNLMLLGMIVAFIQFFVTPVFPESPKDLYLKRKMKDAAHQSIHFYFGKHMRAGPIIERYDVECEETTTLSEMKTVTRLYRLAVKTAVVFFLMGFNGFHVVLTFSYLIFDDQFSMEPNFQLYICIGFCGLCFLLDLISLSVIKTTRPISILLQTGVLGQLVSFTGLLILLVISLELAKFYAIGCVGLVAVFHCLCIRPMRAKILWKLQPREPVYVTIANFMFWFGRLLSIQLFPVLWLYTGAYSFSLFLTGHLATLYFVGKYPYNLKELSTRPARKPVRQGTNLRRLFRQQTNSAVETEV